jgi:zinc transport system permease protein
MLIGSVWSIGMAVGIVAIAHTPGYSTDLMSYLLGNLLMVTPGQVWVMAGLDLLMVGAVGVLYRPLVATVFDEEFARVRGLPTTMLYLGLLVAVALAVVVLVQAVGLVLVMALLTLPAATALPWASSVGRLMFGATAAAGLVIVAGLGVAFETDSPAGATIVLCAALLYLATLALKWLMLRFRRGLAVDGSASVDP